jgi:hypothetical protein
VKVLGAQKIRHSKRLKIWNEEIQNAVNEKKAEYLKSLNSGTIEDTIEYKHKRAIVRKLSMKL